jgi:hypothetical protein
MGWEVFPLAKESKKSVVKWGTEKTTDRFRITEWWSENPDWNIAIATGSNSNLSIVDIDSNEALELFKQHKHLFPDKPNLVAKTPRGYHIYYQYTPLLKQGADVFVIKKNSGIDIRSEGGYVVAPSSVVTDKDYVRKMYTWLK